MGVRASTAATVLEHEGRERKLNALIVGMSGAGIDADQAAHLTDERWRQIADAVGLKRPPSPLTRRIAVERLANGSHERALCPTCGLGDPEGEPGPRKPAFHEGSCAK